MHTCKTFMRWRHHCTTITCTLALLGLCGVAQASGSNFTTSYTGAGLLGECVLQDPGADGALALTGRTGELGIVGLGLVTDLGFQFGAQHVFGRVGVDAFLGIIGLRFDAAWRAGPQTPLELGVAYGLEGFYPSPAPVFVRLGGQWFPDSGDHAWLISAGVFFLGQALDW